MKLKYIIYCRPIAKQHNLTKHYGIGVAVAYPWSQLNNTRTHLCILFKMLNSLLVRAFICEENITEIYKDSMLQVVKID